MARGKAVATHRIPSGMGGTFSVEVMSREGEEALVRIHMPGTEWHHWYGTFRVSASTLVEIVPDEPT